MLFWSTHKCLVCCIYTFFPPLNRCYSYHSPSPYSRSWSFPGGWAGVWTSWYLALPERGSRSAARHWDQSESADELQRKEGLRDTRYKPRIMWWIHSCNSGRTDLFWGSESNIIAGSAASNFVSFFSSFHRLCPGADHDGDYHCHRGWHCPGIHL